MEDHSEPRGNDASLIAEKTAELYSALDDYENSLWRAGDLLIELVAVLGLMLRDLAAGTKWSISRLSEIKKNCEAFPKGKRDLSVSFWEQEIARSALVRVKRDVLIRSEQEPALAGVLQKYVDMDAATVSEMLQSEYAKTGRRLNKREATNFLSAKVRADINAATAKANAIVVDKYLDRCFHMDCNVWLEEFAADEEYRLANPWKAKLVNLDVPYGSYKKLRDGHLDVNTSAAAFVDGDNLDRDAAIKTTIKTISLLPKSGLLGVGTAILLWQSCIELRLPILQAIHDAGLEVEILVVWDKNRPMPGNFNTAWTQNTEHCWVLKQAKDTLIAHGDSKDRGNVMSALDDRFWFGQSASNLDGSHIWSKPISMMEFLISKHTYAGDTVIDLYGCSGSASIAAANLGRRFIYCEMHKQNFDQFSPKVLRGLESAQQKAGILPTAGAVEVETGTAVQSEAA